MVKAVTLTCLMWEHHGKICAGCSNCPMKAWTAHCRTHIALHLARCSWCWWAQGEAAASSPKHSEKATGRSFAGASTKSASLRLARNRFKHDKPATNQAGSNEFAIGLWPVPYQRVCLWWPALSQHPFLRLYFPTRWEESHLVGVFAPLISSALPHPTPAHTPKDVGKTFSGNTVGTCPALPSHTAVGRSPLATPPVAAEYRRMPRPASGILVGHHDSKTKKTTGIRKASVSVAVWMTSCHLICVQRLAIYGNAHSVSDTRTLMSIEMMEGRPTDWTFGSCYPPFGGSHSVWTLPCRSWLSSHHLSCHESSGSGRINVETWHTCSTPAEALDNCAPINLFHFVSDFGGQVFILEHGNHPAIGN